MTDQLIPLWVPQQSASHFKQCWPFVAYAQEFMHCADAIGGGKCVTRINRTRQYREPQFRWVFMNIVMKRIWSNFDKCEKYIEKYNSEIMKRCCAIAQSSDCIYYVPHVPVLRVTSMFLGPKNNLCVYNWKETLFIINNNIIASITCFVCVCVYLAGCWTSFLQVFH